MNNIAISSLSVVLLFAGAPLARALEAVPLEPEFSFSSELLSDGDISLFSQTLRIVPGKAVPGLTLTYGWGHQELDYQPNALVDGVGQALEIDSDTSRYGIEYAHRASEVLELRGSFQVVDGYPDYRSLWLDEYYAQQFTGFENYEEADPGMLGGELGFRWEYSPLTGFLDVGLAYSEETIAPGYERILGGELEQGREEIEATSLSIASENVVNRRLRTRNSLILSDISERDLRGAIRTQWNYAIQSDLVMRGSAHYLREGSEFNAYGIRLGVEKDWGNDWFLGLSYRFYEDDGQLEDSLLIDSSSPALRTDQVLITLRHDFDSGVSAKLFGGFYRTSYEEPESEIAPFANLYNERDWTRFGLSLSKKF